MNAQRLSKLRVVTTGTALFLLTVFTYTRLTMGDPFLSIGGSRRVANGLAMVHFAGVLLVCTRAMWRIRGGDLMKTVAVSASCAVLCWGAALATGVTAPDTLRIYVGYEGWWAAIVFAGATIPTWRTAAGAVAAEWWKRLGVVTLLSFAAGILLYALPLDSAGVMLGKIALILVVPVSGLFMMMTRYEGPHSVLVRGVAGLGGALGVAVATIR